MKRHVCGGVMLATTILCATVNPFAMAQIPSATNDAKAKTFRPYQPGGILRDQLGVYLTIEGVRTDAGKVESGTLLVDTVDGQLLQKPIPVLIRTPGYPPKHIKLPVRQRCVFRGYESGGMIGIPQAVYAAATEQGRTESDVSPKPFSWRPYFVVLIVAEPNGLELPNQ